MSNLLKQKLKTLFENRFNKEEFSSFVANLLNEVESESAFIPLRGASIKAPFQEGVEEYERVCKYVDTLGNQIDVLIVKLKNKNKLENARTFQRNFVIDYLNGGSGGKLKDAALVAFYSEDSPDWRFSFVKLEYELSEEDGKIKENKKMNSAKRYSYLVGEHENSHTAQSQLLPLLEDDKNNPTLKQIENAFSVETVTKEFFEKYKDLFIQVNTHLEDVIRNDQKVKKDFNDKEISVVDFSKKLLGQIIFLYFLQKKGWFGVKLNDSWGEGDKGYLRSIFKESNREGKNFFNDYLEPLFYEALARERDGNYYSRFDCKIPFLNGGLFDPISEYDWWNTVINLPNELFSNDYISQDKNKDKGTGILDVFDRYNFTVREDEPLEKEVAIDPEMLGKIFERLSGVNSETYPEWSKAILEKNNEKISKLNKKFGVYYTPREIVHFMCQESLINYLNSNLSGVVKKEDIIYLIKEVDLHKASETDLAYKDNQDWVATIRNHTQTIDRLLADIKVCDPAIGSGAFPVGMMHEIVKVRSVIACLSGNYSNTEYEFKRHTIANSLYGVDIDQGAVEIAKLRLWLSLIVDEEDITNIKTLPNLEYKIMQGNSLIEEYEGIELFDDNLLSNIDNEQDIQIRNLKDRQQILQRNYFEMYHIKSKEDQIIEIENELKKIKKSLSAFQSPKDKHEEINLFRTKDEAKEKADRLLILQKRYFEVSLKSEKEKIKIAIENLIWELIEITVKKEGNNNKLNHILKLRKSNNKPFFLWKLHFAEVFIQKGGFDVVIANPPYGADLDDQSKVIIKKKLADTKNLNTAATFIDFAKNQWVNKKGTLTYIVPKSLLYSEKWFDLVKALAGKVPLLVDVEKAFDNVKLEQVVFLFGNLIHQEYYTAYKFLENNFVGSIQINYDLVRKFGSWLCDVREEELILGNRIFDSKTKMLSDISITKRGLGIQNEISTKGDFPVIGGRNIASFSFQGQRGYLERDKIQKYENKLKFLLQPKIISQDLIAHIQNPFPHIKIVSALDSTGDVIGLDTVQNTIITDQDYDLYFILALLNSKLISWYTYRFIYSGAVRTMHFDSYYIGKIPIKMPNDFMKAEIISKVKEILSYIQHSNNPNEESTLSSITILLKQIDQLIYDLYSLTKSDVKVIDPV